MGITGDGLMTVQADGAATVHQTIVPLTLHGGLARAVSASQLDDGDTLCSLTLWYRYDHIPWDFCSSCKNTYKPHSFTFVVGCVTINCFIPLFYVPLVYWTGK